MDPTIRGRLQYYKNLYTTWLYLQTQYRINNVRARHLAANHFEQSTLPGARMLDRILLIREVYVMTKPRTGPGRSR